MILKKLNDFPETEKNLLGLFGVDVGNHDTKTRNTTFASGYKTTSVVNKLNTDYISMIVDGDKQYFVLQNAPFNTSFDKTKTEEMFVITLFAIAKEAIARGISLNENAEIDIAIGMPPGAYNDKMISAYREYYLSRGKNICFKYNETDFCFDIKNVVVSAQCWGAAAQYPHLHKDLSDVYLVDIGGGTTDVLHMRKGQIDGQPLSYSDGVNKMFAEVANALNAETGIRFTPENIKDILSGNSDVPDKYVEAVKKRAKDWTKNIFTRMMTEGVEFRLTKVITLGGGSILLDKYIEETAQELEFAKRLSIPDSRANATGYELTSALALYGIKPRVVNDFWTNYKS